MTPEQFIYWLQGFLEVSQARTIDATGVDQIRKHLALVLTNVTAQDEVKPMPSPEKPSLPRIKPDIWRKLIHWPDVTRPFLHQKLCSSKHSDTRILC